MFASKALNRFNGNGSRIMQMVRNWKLSDSCRQRQNSQKSGLKMSAINNRQHLRQYAVTVISTINFWTLTLKIKIVEAEWRLFIKSGAMHDYTLNKVASTVNIIFKLSLRFILLLRTRGILLLTHPYYCSYCTIKYLDFYNI